MSFANRLKDLRIKANLSQAELAAKLGITQAAIGHWESGAREGPSPDQFFRLCEVLGVDCTDFKDPSESKQPRRKK